MEKIRVLMIDDNTSLVEMVKEYFTGHKKIAVTHTCKDGEEGLTTILADLGLKETFGQHPNFEKIADYDMFISNVAQKTFIDLSENGTKAAAVTVITFDANALPSAKPEVVKVNFDKPFVYLIKDANSDEILFFGVVYSPTEYKDGDVLCEEVDE